MTNKVTFELLSVSAVGEAISAIATRAKNMQHEIHVAACSVLSHVQEHGDYRGVVSLLNALPNGQRVNGLALWFQNFSDGALQLKKANGSWSCSLLDGWKDKCLFDVEGAMQVDFGSFSKEPTPKAMTLEKIVKWVESKANADDKEVEPSAKAAAAMMVAAYRERLTASLTH